MSNVSESLQLPGTVLVDNTTMYGAKYAYETWPPKPESWHEGLNAVNLRSLMDLLEALVLYDRIVVDASSRSRLRRNSPDYDPSDFITYHPVGDLYEFIWPTRYLLGGKPGQGTAITDDQRPSIIFNVEFINVGRGSLISALAQVAFTRLLRYLHDGAFAEAARRFEEDGVDFVIPPFYQTPRQFGALFKDSLPIHLPHDVGQLLDQVEHSLERCSARESNYAMFAYRGFYYQELARLFSMSYSPHTWRSNLIDLDSERPSMNFATYVTEVSGRVRQELAERLNKELSTTIFSGDFPVLATYIAHQCESRSHLYEAAMQIRNTASVCAFRRWIAEVQSAVQSESDLPKVAKAQSELEATMNDIRKELGLLRGGVKERVTVKVGFAGASLEGPIPVPSDVPDWLKLILKRRPHLLFLREITKKSVSFSPFALRYHQLRP